MRYSKITGGFYPVSENYTNLPTDLIDITDADYNAAMNLSAGETIGVVNGIFAIIPPTAAALAIINAPVPNSTGFIQDIKNALGGIVAANAVAVTYPLFFTAVQEQHWLDVQVLLIDAKTKNMLTTQQYSDIKTAVLNNNIPLTLP